MTDTEHRVGSAEGGRVISLLDYRAVADPDAVLLSSADPEPVSFTKEAPAGPETQEPEPVIEGRVVEHQGASARDEDADEDEFEDWAPSWHERVQALPAVPAALQSKEAALQALRDVGGDAKHGATHVATHLPLYAGRELGRAARFYAGAVAGIVRWLYAPEDVALVEQAREQAREQKRLAKSGKKNGVGAMGGGATAVKTCKRALRKERERRLAVGSGLGLIAAGALVAEGLVIHAYTPAWLQWTGALYPLAAVAATLAVVGAVGQRVRDHLAPAAGDAALAVEAAAEDQPWPIEEARTRAEAVECLHASLRAEGLAVASITDPHRHHWGWELTVELSAKTPEVLVSKAKDLETRLGLGENKLLVQPHRKKRARATIRAVIRDPFAGMKPLPDVAPNQHRIADPVLVAQRMDAQQYRLVLMGTHILVVGSSGSGKSATLRTLALGAMACEDAQVWDLDASGSGLDALGPGVARRERASGWDDKGVKQMPGIEKALEDALKMADARAQNLIPWGHGDSWHPSPDEPAILVVIDEYKSLSKRAKELAVALLDVGRKARITLIIGALDGTEDTLGDAIAAAVAVRAMLACRSTDIPLVFGTGATGAGWRPDRLQPLVEGMDPEDADPGVLYIQGGGSREPLLHKTAMVGPAEAMRRGIARAEAGIPPVDRRTQRAAGVELPAPPEADQEQPAESAAADHEPYLDESGRDLLMDVLDGIDAVGATTAKGQGRGHLDTLAGWLAETWPDTYDGWDASRLGTELRGLGVRTHGSVRVGDEGPRTGVKGEEIETLLKTAAEAPSADVEAPEPV